MATFNGVNYALKTAEPTQKVQEGEVKGKVSFLYDEITLAGEVAPSDTILLGANLPKGARVIDAGILSGALGAPAAVNCQIRLGYAGSDAAFIAQASVATAVKLKMGSEVGLLARLSADTQPVITVNTASAGAAGKKIQVWIEYVMD